MSRHATAENATQREFQKKFSTFTLFNLIQPWVTKDRRCYPIQACAGNALYAVIGNALSKRCRSFRTNLMPLLECPLLFLFTEISTMFI
jgi:hypothetical protein